MRQKTTGQSASSPLCLGYFHKYFWSEFEMRTMRCCQPRNVVSGRALVLTTPFGVSQCLKKPQGKFYVLFIDLTAAYDKIPRLHLFLCLARRMKCHLLLGILKAIYTDTSAKIKGSKQDFPVRAGVRQGALESPIVFNIYFDFVLKILKKRLVDELGDDFGICFDYFIPV